MMGRSVAVGMLMLLVAGPGLAQTVEPTVALSAQPTPASVGDRVTITVSVEHAAADSVVWPEILETMGPFEVAEAELVRPVETETGLRSDLRLVVSAFELGDLEFPSLPVAVVSGDGNRETDLTTDPLVIPVESVGLDESGDIRDIKPPLAMPRSVVFLLGLVLLFAFLGAAAYLLYRRLRRPGAEPEPEVERAEPVRPPEDVALEALRALHASSMLDQGEFKPYYIEASQILRVYLHGRFGIDAMEMDTHDILDRLRRERVSMDLHQRFVEFFSQCDLVKFAKHEPARHRADDLVPLAMALVEDTAPPPTPSEAAA